MRQGCEISLALIGGSNNLNLTIHEMIGNLPSDVPGAATFLRQRKPTHDWLSEQFPMSVKQVGIGLPRSETMGRRIRANGNGKWDSLLCPSRGWASWLGAAGHAFAMSAQPHVNALAGSIVWSLGDEQIRDWLSQGVLLDGEAAGIVVERGLGQWIGVKGAHRVAQKDTLYTIETCTDQDFGIRVGGRMLLDGRPHSMNLFQGDLMGGALRNWASPGSVVRYYPGTGKSRRCRRVPTCAFKILSYSVRPGSETWVCMVPPPM